MLNLVYLRRHNKKILAFFGVFLMIAFILPSTTKQGDSQKGEHGTAYGQTITENEYINAQNDLLMLRQRLVRGQYLELSLAQRFMGLPGYADVKQILAEFRRLPNEERAYVAGEAQRISGRLDNERMGPINLALLLREARRMNVAPRVDQVEEILEWSKTAESTELKADELAWRRQALTDWLTILAAFDRVTEVSRMSAAMAAWDAANTAQRASLQLVHFRSVDFEKAAGKPTEEQLEAFFKTYQNMERETSENGVGYRFPNRVRLQYVKITKAKAIESVTKDDAAEYWYNHQNEFVALPDEPATQPSTRSATQPASQPAQVASTQPTTRPWAEGNKVDKQIREMLGEQRMVAIAKAVQTRISAEWPAFLEASRTENKTIPDNPPNTEYGVPYNSWQFLLRVCDKVQGLKTSHNLLPEAHQLDRLYSASELREMTDVGKAVFGRDPLPEYLTTFLDPFLTEKTRKLATDLKKPTMKVLEPSRMSTPAWDQEGNLYLVRVLEADPARPATDLKEVRLRAEMDWLLVESLKKAREAAEKFLVVAKEKGLVAAAKEQDMGGMVVETDPFSNQPSEKIGKYELPDPARVKLIQETFDLVQKRIRTGEPRPLALIDLPKASRVVVAQLADAKPATGGFELEMKAARTQEQYFGMRGIALLGEWFDPANLHKRTLYQADSRLKKSSEE